MKKIIILGFSLLCQVAFSQAEWEMIYGSDSIFSVRDVFMIDTAHIWGIYTNSIFTSSDWGQTWDEQFHHDDYNFADVFFVDSITGWVVGWSEVLKTEDGGVHWTLQTLPNPLGLDVKAVYFINPDTGWIAGSYKTIYVTYDGGNNWASQYGYQLYNHFSLYDIHFFDELHGCAVGGSLISQTAITITTDDGGETWVETFPSSDELLKNVQYVNEFMVWTCDSDGRLIRSYDGGFTWEIADIIPLLHPQEMHFFNEYEAILASNSGHTALTSDAWNSYQKLELYYYNSFTDFSFVSDFTGIATGSGNVLRTYDGGYNWTRINDRFYRIAFFSPFNGWIVQAPPLNKNFMHTTDGGFNWEEVEMEHNGSLLQMHFPDDQTGFAITDKSELLKTFNAGYSWEIINIAFDSTYYSDIQFLDENTGFLCATPNTLLKTVNGGQDWEEFLFGNLNFIMAVDFLNSDEGWIIGTPGFVAHTTDGCVTWTITTLPSNGLIDVNFVNKTTGFIVSFYGSVFRTSNGGTTWEDLGLNFNHPENIFFHDALNGWITDRYKIYRTYDGGDSWYEMLDAQCSNFQDQITGLSAMDTNMVWICTMDGRVFNLLEPSNINNLVRNDPINYYPNPVSDQLTIELNHHPQDPLTINIFSIVGKLMVSRNYSASQRNSFTLNMSGLANGIYILNIEGSTISCCHKIVKR